VKKLRDAGAPFETYQVKPAALFYLPIKGLSFACHFENKNFKNILL